MEAVKREDLFNLVNYISSLDEKSDEYLKAIDVLKAMLGTEVYNFYQLQAYIESQLNMVADMQEDLAVRKVKLEKQKTKLKEFAKFLLQSAKVKKITDDITGHYILLKDTPGEVIIDDLTALPDYLVRKEVKYTPDKTAIKEHLKAGEKVPGCRIEKSESVMISKPRGSK